MKCIDCGNTDNYHAKNRCKYCYNKWKRLTDINFAIKNKVSNKLSKSKWRLINKEKSNSLYRKYYEEHKEQEQARGFINNIIRRT